MPLPPALDSTGHGRARQEWRAATLARPSPASARAGRRAPVPRHRRSRAAWRGSAPPGAGGRPSPGRSLRRLGHPRTGPRAEGGVNLGIHIALGPAHSEARPRHGRESQLLGKVADLRQRLTLDHHQGVRFPAASGARDQIGVRLRECGPRRPGATEEDGQGLHHGHIGPIERARRGQDRDRAAERPARLMREPRPGNARGTARRPAGVAAPASGAAGRSCSRPWKGRGRGARRMPPDRAR